MGLSAVYWQIYKYDKNGEKYWREKDVRATTLELLTSPVTLCWRYTRIVVTVWLQVVSFSAPGIKNKKFFHRF